MAVSVPTLIPEVHTSSTAVLHDSLREEQYILYSYRIVFIVNKSD